MAAERLRVTDTMKRLESTTDIVVNFLMKDRPAAERMFPSIIRHN